MDLLEYCEYHGIHRTGYRPQSQDEERQNTAPLQSSTQKDERFITFDFCLNMASILSGVFILCECIY